MSAASDEIKEQGYLLPDDTAVPVVGELAESRLDRESRPGDVLTAVVKPEATLGALLAAEPCVAVAFDAVSMPESVIMFATHCTAVFWVAPMLPR